MLPVVGNSDASAWEQTHHWTHWHYNNT